MLQLVRVFLGKKGKRIKDNEEKSQTEKEATSLGSIKDDSLSISSVQVSQLKASVKVKLPSEEDTKISAFIGKEIITECCS